jgi:hypothetical protein
MPSPDRDASAREPRRWFVGIGVGEYDDATLKLDHALGDVRRMSAWFTTVSRVRHEVALAELAENPTFDQISKGLAKFLQSCAIEEVVVLYIACHGEEENTVSYLFGRDSPSEMLAGRAVVAEQVGQMLGSSPPHNVLIIIDACVGGAIAAAVADATKKAIRGRNSRDPHRRYSQVIISSTFGLSPAQDGKFVDAFLRTVADERWTGTVLPWISLAKLLEGINEELQSSSQSVECTQWSNGGEIQLIPNPNVGRRETSTLFDDEAFAAHFDPASRGVSRGERGSFFTGRTDELIRVNEWLRRPVPKQAGMFVITGSPGSGKSALLSHVAVLSSSPELRQRALDADRFSTGTVPESGALDAVIWCHGKTQQQFIGEIARVMGGNAATPNALMTLASARSEPLVIAVDALDEAVGGEAEKMAREVLAPLSRDTAHRFLIATRRYPVGGARVDLLKALAAPEPLYLDAAANRRRDMADYVERRLAARDFPVGNDEEGKKTRKLADDIAEAARESFLVASIAARTVVRGELEKFKLPSDVGQALAGYLDRLPIPERARDVLRPLAWAQGPGLPWGTLWPMLATRLAAGQGPVKDAAIAATLDAAGDLIVESVNAGEPVYRLFHEALAEHLRDTTPAGTWAPKIIASGLLDIRDGRAWADVPRYVRTFLPSFLMRAEMANELRDLLLDPTWVRQRRLDTGDSMAVLHDVEAACALFRKRRASSDLAQLCYQYSRLMTSALPPLIELLARSGQSVRAEAMAGNLEEIADRMLTYRALAIVHGENGDAGGAARYVHELMRCLPAMHADHQPMAWCWAAEAAAWSARLSEQAKSAAEEALKSVALSDDWDRLNGLFWAAKAAHASKSDNVRGQVAVQINAFAQQPVVFRNQALQAAALAGCTGLLKAKLAEVMARPPGGHSPVRIGNLGLALADAGLKDEMTQLVARVGQAAPSGEQDSLKRWAWALALSGRHAAAIDALAWVYEPFERSKALARIADVIASTDDKPQIERLAKLIDDEKAEPGSRTEARLVLASWKLGKREEALAKAEKAIAANAQPGVMIDPRADSRSQPMGAHDASGKKTARRAMTTSRAPTFDEVSCRNAQTAADKGDLAAAREIAAGIEIPRYRAQALGRIVQKEPDDTAAEDVWMAALIAAIRGGRALAEEIIEIMLLRWMDAKRSNDGADLAIWLHDTDFTWQCEFFTDEYAALRAMFEPGEMRTRILDRLMQGPIALGGNLVLNDNEDLRRTKIRKTWERGTDGDRLFSLGVMAGHIRLIMADLLVDAIRNSRSAFEQYYGLRAALEAVDPPGLVVKSWLPLKADGKTAIVRAINDELAGVPRADGSPSFLGSNHGHRALAERILAKIGGKG